MPSSGDTALQEPAEVQDETQEHRPPSNPSPQPQLRPHSILDVIGGGRWSRALFTSFTLSLTHFESYIWPRLRRAGCERVDILVDKLGFVDSLMERHCRGVGRQYIPSPVAMRTGGVFHPKLVYLWSALDPRHDLLLVGSGNLTYPGHGGNLEVLEVLGASRHAGAFAEAAEFFESLATSPSVDIADTAALTDCAARSIEAATLGESVEPARFIHCLDAPGIEQFESAARQLAQTGTEWKELLVLSPFHHPRAAPVRRLLTQLDIGSLLVGVPSRPAETSPFAFSVAREWTDVQFQCVAPVAPKAESRSLHAKWLELRATNRALVLTGSFNATDESMCSTKNVECGVLRELSEPTDCWLEAPQPVYKRTIFERGAASATAVVWATLTNPSTIRGRLLGASTAWVGPAEAIAEAGHACVAQGVVQLDSSLGFEWRLDKPLVETRDASIQISLETTAGLARGWVSVQRILRLDPTKRELLGLVTQLESGNETVDDMKALVEYLTSETAALIASLPDEHQPIPAAASGGRDASSDREQLAKAQGMASAEFQRAAKSALDAAMNWSPAGQLLGVFGHGQDSWAVVEQVLDALRGAPVRDMAPSQPDTQGFPVPSNRLRRPSSNGTDVVDDDAEESRNRNRIRVDAKQLLLRLEEGIGERIARIEPALRQHQPLPGHSGASAALCIARHMWVLVHTGLRLCTTHLRDDDTTEAFVRRFLKNAAERHRAWLDVRLLDEVVAGVAAFVALTSLTPGRETQHELSALNALLEDYFGVDRDVQDLQALATNWLGCELGARLLGDSSVADARAALAMTLGEPSPRALVVRALVEGSDSLGREPYRSWEPRRRQLLAGALRDVRASKEPALRTFNPRVGYSHRGCYVDLRTGRDGNGNPVLDRDFAADLTRWRLAACPNCSRVLVWSTP